MSSAAAKPRQDRLAPLRELFADRRLVAMTGLGFASGIPFLLVYITQSAWLSDAGVAIGTLGLLSEMTLAYKFKWLWAPFLDRYDAPLLARLLGRRRGWIVASQIAIMATLVGIAAGDPAHRLAWTVAFSLLLGVAGATQDIAIDGWRITAAPVERQALMSSWSEVGWRFGNLVAGAGALYLADAVGWHAAYLCMAGAMSVGTVAALLAPEPPSDAERTTASAGRPGGQAFVLDAGDRPAGFIVTVWAPIRELLGRLGRMAVPVLLLIAGFRMPGYISSAMAVPLFKSLHYSNSDIATVTKLFGFPVAIAGTFVATFVVKRIGLGRALLCGTVFASASHLSLAWLAAHGDHGGGEFWLFATSVSVDEFAYAFASIILITYMSALSSPAFAAAQYALLTSLCALPGSILAGTSGYLIARMSFEGFFASTALIGLPVAVLCWWIIRNGVGPAGEDVTPARP